MYSLDMFAVKWTLIGSDFSVFKQGTIIHFVCNVHLNFIPLLRLVRYGQITFFF